MDSANPMAEAIILYTRNAAFDHSEEGYKRAIDTRKFADLVVLRWDIRELPTDEIANTTLIMTMVGGRIVYGSTRFHEMTQKKRNAA